MKFNNAKPTAADFFRKYADLVTEAEKDDDDKKDKECNVCKCDPCKCEENKDKKSAKKPLKESTTYQRMMGIKPGQINEDSDDDEDPDVAIADKEKGKDKKTQKDAEKKLPPWLNKGLDKADKKAEEKGAKKTKADKDLDESENLEEKWDKKVTLNPAKKGTMPKSKAKVDSELSSLKKSGPHKKGSPEFTKEKELAFAKRAKSGWKESVEESISSEFNGLSKSELQSKLSALNADGPYREGTKYWEQTRKLKAMIKSAEKASAKKEVKESMMSEVVQYADGSADWESDVSDINQALMTCKRILRSPEWNDWMQSTDSNYSPEQSAVQMSEDLANRVLEAQKLLDEFYHMMSSLG